MSFAYTAVIGSAVIGGVASNKAANKVASSSKKASQRAIDEQIRQYDTTRADYAPYREAGEGALNQLSDPRANFEASPGYEFARSEGTRDVGNFFSARNSGGNAMRALTEFQTGLAQQDYGNWWNRQAGLVNAGRGATAGTAQAGMNAANNIGSAAMWNGANQANAAVQRYSGINNALQSGIGNYLYGQGAGLWGNNVNQPSSPGGPGIWGRGT